MIAYHKSDNTNSNHHPLQVNIYIRGTCVDTFRLKKQLLNDLLK